ncbi:nuclear export protein noc3 [Lichtheimia corymbifera JMRC:FSU:9682]|uniref:Nucleolar complex-associated protein 3 n=1 Tax=Lichtheimia corymbifera JMRC:FSU:9682 TaxID=1263082 RepID=A0A068RI53_9FUNG|nr:nuclear export protein noc3 [Lichtheimia corymbifera JMRC:FSU:9682]
MAGKQAIKKANKAANKSKQAANKKGNDKPTKKAVNKPGSKNAKSKDPLDKIPDYVPVPEADNEDVDISDEDLAFFAENEQFGTFLKSMDSKAITKNLTRDEKPRIERPESKKKQQQEQQQPSSESESDEEDYDYDDLENMASDEVASIVLSSSDEEEEEPMEEDVPSSISDIEDELENMEQTRPSKKRKHVESDDEEMDYELQPRKVGSEWTQKDFVERLPIKLPGGKIVKVDQEDDQEKQEESADEMSQEEEEEQVVEDKAAQVEEEPAPKLTKKQYILAKKEELAQIATQIQEDPDENINQLKALRKITADSNPTVKKLALLTQLAVYKDIIPGYRIRPLTEKEEAVKVSKDVKKLREFEKTLLHNYELYLKELDILLKRKSAQSDTSLITVAVKCLCELLTTKTHFNFRLNLMMSIVTRMSTVQWNEDADLCSKAIINVFEEDETGRVSLDAVTMITRMIKSKNYQVHENVINTFLHLRLKDELTPEASKKPGDGDKPNKKRKKEFLTKKARKARKETKEVEKEMKEAEAVVDKEEREKTHTETLKLVFAFYFRILKKQSTSPLLPAVLQGLGKFAHLISVDFFDDLLAALKEVLDSLEHSTSKGTAGAGTRKRLLCIITAFELLSGQGEAFVTYDLKEYYSALYEILFESTFHYMIEHKPNPDAASESDMLIRGLELMFVKKRQIPIDRMAAFIKRFCIVALNMPTKTVANCMQLVKQLISKDRRLDALVQSEDRAASGVYMPYLQDPELCNPFGTSLYELFLYKDHYDPNIRSFSQSILQPPETQ